MMFSFVVLYEGVQTAQAHVVETQNNECSQGTCLFDCGLIPKA